MNCPNDLTCPAFVGAKNTNCLCNTGSLCMQALSCADCDNWFKCIEVINDRINKKNDKKGGI